MSEQDLQLLWYVYLAAACGCLLVGWGLSGWMWRWLRGPLRVLLFVLLFTPTLVDPLKSLHAPAAAMLAIDVLTFAEGGHLRDLIREQGTGAALGQLLDSISPMIWVDFTTVAAPAVAIWLLWTLLCWLWSRRKAAKPEEVAEQVVAADTVDAAGTERREPVL